VKAKPKKPEFSRFQVRIPVGLKKQIEDIANKECRSMNYQIVFLLEHALTSEAVPAGQSLDGGNL
jgi:hypothetical protein